jgi:hypothetical protein
MIFYTGSSGRLLSLNPTNLSVELLAPPPMSMGSNSVFAFKDGKIVYWGGAISGTYYNNGYLYDVTNNTWSTITQTNLGIEARGGAVYVWAGNMLIIFGGNGGTNLNNGQLLGSTYPLSGNVSNFRIDSGTLKKAKWNTISWNGTAPTSGSSTTAIKFRTRGTNSTNQTILDDPDTNMTGDPNTGWTYWNQDNTGSTFYTISNSSIVTPATRYLDVQLTLTSNDGALTPTLNDFRVDYDTLESPSSICLSCTSIFIYIRS